MRARQDGEADDIGILLERRGDDLLRSLPKARVDNLHPRIPQGASDNFGATVMTVETGLGDDDADFSHLDFGLSDSWTPDSSDS